MIADPHPEKTKDEKDEECLAVYVIRDGKVAIEAPSVSHAGTWLELMREADRITIATVARYGGNPSFREMEVGRAVAHAFWRPRVGCAPVINERSESSSVTPERSAQKDPETP